MKAPFSEKARHVFSNDEAAQKVMNAARKGESIRVEVEGKTYLVRRVSQTAPDRLEGSQEGSRGWLDLLPF